MLEQLPDSLGEALDRVRAGMDQTLFHSIDLHHGMAAITLQSLAFVAHGPIPQRYTADGHGASPPLHWSGVPPQATEVVLVVEDADSPTPHPVVHAIVVAVGPAAADAAPEDISKAPSNLAVDVRGDGALAEGAMSRIDGADTAATMGRNSLLQAEWLPPDPPPGHGVHHFAFQIFALEAGHPLPENPGRDAVRSAIIERGLASGCLIGTYERPSGRIDAPLSERAAFAAAAPSA